MMKGIRNAVRMLSGNTMIIAVAALLLGTMIGRYRVFPFEILATAKRTFISENRTTIWSNPNYTDRLALFAKSRGRSDIVMLGDSIIADGDWIDLARGDSIANRAIGGDTTEGLRSRLDDVLRLRPRVVFLMIGVNDFLANRSVDDVYHDYAAILDRLQMENVAVIIQATLLVGTKNPFFYEINKKIDKLNTMLLETAHSRRLLYFNTNAALAPAGVLDRVFTKDGIHINHRGYSCWVSMLLAVQHDGWNQKAIRRETLPDCRTKFPTFAAR